MASRKLLSMLVAMLLQVLCMPLAMASQGPTIAAAADLRVALGQIADAFEKETGKRVTLVYGSSGNFHRQLRQGAPFEMFLSADEDYVFDLAGAGKAPDTGALYAIGRLVLVAPKGSRLTVDGNLVGLRKAVRNKQITRFALANPEHAPYGKRAEEALRHARLWRTIAPKLVLGENVAQALQFATAGGAQGGIVAYSLVFDPALKGKLRYALIPASWHRPLRQRMVLMKGAGPVARQFYAYLGQAKARRILARNGFALPTGTP